MQSLPRPILSLKSKDPGPLPAQECPPPIAALDHFWFLWNPLRTRPKKRHATIELARAERDRLRELLPDETFFIYEATRLIDEVQP